MSTKKDGGPAFPVAGPGGSYGKDNGMSLRDFFAAAALVGLKANPHASGTTEEHAERCYRAADALLKERERGEG